MQCKIIVEVLRYSIGAFEEFITAPEFYIVLLYSNNILIFYPFHDFQGLYIVKLYTGLPLLITGCKIQGLFQDFPGPFQANSRTFCIK